jgi:hypothetical protein
VRRSSAFSALFRGFRAIACVTVASGVAVSVAGAECVPWPGEPVPVPTTASNDPLDARWAAVRATELAALATELAASAPADADRLWAKVACLDPTRAAALGADERAAVVRVHRPLVERADLPDTQAASDVTAALDRLDRPIYLGRHLRGAEAPAATVAASPRTIHPGPPAVGTPEAPREAPAAPVAPPPAVSTPPPDPRELAAADGLLDQAETLLRQARFEEALDRAAKARAVLPRTGGAPLRARRARAEVVTGTAEVALGREGEARATFERAVRTDPSLTLDPAQTSPKVLRAFDAARIDAEGAP